MSTDSTLSFDRMRGMLVRAAEIRDSEQQQIFDSLDEIHARLAALDALGTIRKRLTELPDRSEVGVLAERLDEALAKVDAQDTRAGRADPGHRGAAGPDGPPDRQARRAAGRDGRPDGGHRGPDGRAGRPARRPAQAPRRPGQPAGPARDAARRDAVLGRRAGQGAHRRRRARGARAARRQRPGRRREPAQAARARPAPGWTSGSTELAARPAVDPTEPLAGLANRLEALAGRLDELGERLDKLEDGVGNRLGTLGGSIEEKFGRLDAVLERRPDSASLSALVSRANEESERRNAGQLDEAMATFAELILGRGGSVQSPPPPPRPAQRRGRSKVAVKSPNGASASDTVTDDPDEH